MAYTGWGEYIGILGRPRHTGSPTMDGNILTDALTVTDVSVNDNGAQYRCEPTRDVISMPVTITTLGKNYNYFAILRI